MRKKIAHLTFNMHFGGTERVIYHIVENADKNQYDQSIIIFDPPIGQFGKNLQKNGTKIFALNRKPGFDISLITAIRHIITTEKIAILHCHQYAPYVYGVFAALVTQTKVIFTEHGRFYPDRKKPIRVLINPILNLFTNVVTTISAATSRALAEYENFPRKRIKIIYNGIADFSDQISDDRQLRQSLGLRDDAIILGSVARLDSIKNHTMMVKALTIVRNEFPNAYLILVGDGPERTRLELLAAELNLSQYVIFTGFQEETYQYYRIMDIFLLTSFSEGTAMTLLEAMACSLPCIVTNVGGNPEIVVENKTGFLIPSDDEEQLAEKISNLLKNRELSERMARSGRIRYENEFAVEKMAQSYYRIYDSLMD